MSAKLHRLRGGRPVNNKAAMANTPPKVTIHQVTMYLSSDCLISRFQEVCRTALMSSSRMATMGMLDVTLPQNRIADSMQSHQWRDSWLVFLHAHAYTIDPYQDKENAVKTF